MRYWYLGLVALALVALWVGFESRSRTDPVVIRTHDVSPALAAEVESAVNSLLVRPNEYGHEYGRARMISADLMAVSAPESLQAGIAKVIDQLESSTQAEPARIRAHVWLVSGTPAPSVQVPGEAAALAGVLEQVSAVAGAKRYEVLDYVQSAFRSGARGSVHGGDLSGQVDAIVRGERIAARVELSSRASGNRNIQTEIDFKIGETVLLAQTGQGDQDEGVRLFIVRVETF